MSDKKYKDEDLLKRLYWNEEMSIYDIADKLNVSYKTIYNYMEKFEIKRRSLSEAQEGKKNHNWKGGKKEVKCTNCGTIIKKYPSSIRKTKHNRYFCNRKCYNKWAKGKNNPMYGKIHSEEAKEKMSEIHKGKKLSEEHKQKLREASKGRTHSEETKEKISEAHKGKTFSEEHKQNLSESKSGKKNPSWKGGHEKIDLEEKYGDYDYWVWKAEQRRKKDNYSCQFPNCNMSNKEHKEKYNKKLHVHHIKPRSEFNKDKFDWYIRAHDLANLKTYCLPHHMEIEYRNIGDKNEDS